MSEQGNDKNIRFDDYVDNYKLKIHESIAFLGQNVDFYIEIKVKNLLQLAEKHLGQLNEIDALDVGCGIGLIDKGIHPFVKSLIGVDVENGVIEKARTFNPDVEYRLYDGKILPFENESFHLTFAVNVIHHVPVERWQNFVNEMQRVLKPGGLAVVYEHNPANPLTRRVVKNCEFDRDAVLLSHKKIMQLFSNSGLKVVEDAFIIFFPFRGSLFRSAESLLKRFPLGAQQLVSGRKL